MFGCPAFHKPVQAEALQFDVPLKDRSVLTAKHVETVGEGWPVGPILMGIATNLAPESTGYVLQALISMVRRLVLEVLTCVTLVQHQSKYAIFEAKCASMTIV